MGAQRMVRMARAQADVPHWSEALAATVALWTLVLFVWLPIIFQRHEGDIISVLMDSASVLLSIALGMALFTAFCWSAGFHRNLRWPILLTGVLLASMVQAGFDQAYTIWIATHVDPSWGSGAVSMAQVYSVAMNYLLVFAVNVSLFHLSLSRQQIREQERRLARAESAAEKAQLAALRFQLNPHFLFNTLNAISAMIVTRRNDEAEEMTDKLSRFLRASLASDPEDCVRLEEEIALVEDYLEIERVRFGERVAVEIDLAPDTLAVMVPSLLLQPLVENAVKYGVAPSTSRTRIHITAQLAAEGLVIMVEDDGRGDTEQVGGSPAGTGVGLVNIRQRLEALYGAAGTLAITRLHPGFRAEVVLPARMAPQPRVAA